MMMMQQMVNSGVDPFLGPSIVTGAAATSMESHAAGQRNTDSGLGQYTLHTLLSASSLSSICLLIALYILPHCSISVTGIYEI